MDSEYKQRISLYLDKEKVEKMDKAINKYGYRSRNDFVSSAVLWSSIFVTVMAKKLLMVTLLSLLHTGCGNR